MKNPNQPPRSVEKDDIPSTAEEAASVFEQGLDEWNKARQEHQESKFDGVDLKSGVGLEDLSIEEAREYAGMIPEDRTRQQDVLDHINDKLSNMSYKELIELGQERNENKDTATLDMIQSALVDKLAEDVDKHGWSEEKAQERLEFFEKQIFKGAEDREKAEAAETERKEQQKNRYKELEDMISQDAGLDHMRELAVMITEEKTRQQKAERENSQYQSQLDIAATEQELKTMAGEYLTQQDGEAPLEAQNEIIDYINKISEQDETAIAAFAEKEYENKQATDQAEKSAEAKEAYDNIQRLAQEIAEARANINDMTDGEALELAAKIKDFQNNQNILGGNTSEDFATVMAYHTEFAGLNDDKFLKQVNKKADRKRHYEKLGEAQKDSEFDPSGDDIEAIIEGSGLLDSQEDSTNDNNEKDRNESWFRRARKLGRYALSSTFMINLFSRRNNRGARRAIRQSR